jgi:hypothetical protein
LRSLVGSRTLIYTRFVYYHFMSNEAARFRKQAEEAREHAAKAISPLDKEAWLRVAEDWLKLASSADDRK